MTHLIRLMMLLAAAGLLTACPTGLPSQIPVDDDDTGDDDDIVGDDDDSAPDDDDIAPDDDDIAPDDDDIAPDDDDTAPVDADGDGFDETEDCDDEDADVNPGAAEVPCDGLDNDCDGSSGCQPCEQGSVQTLGAIPVGPSEQIGSLIKGDQVHGLEQDRYFDLLGFHASVTGFHNFDLVSVDFDAYVAIYDSGCLQIAADDDSGGNTDAAVTGLWLTVGDEIRVLISSAQEREVGAYQLFLEAWGL